MKLKLLNYFQLQHDVITVYFYGINILVDCIKLWNKFALVSSLNQITNTKITIKLCLTVLLNVSLNKYIHKYVHIDQYPWNKYV